MKRTLILVWIQIVTHTYVWKSRGSFETWLPGKRRTLMHVYLVFWGMVGPQAVLEDQRECGWEHVISYKCRQEWVAVIRSWNDKGLKRIWVASVDRLRHDLSNDVEEEPAWATQFSKVRREVQLVINGYHKVAGSDGW